MVTSLKDEQVRNNTSPSSVPHYLRLLIPGSDINDNLCKTLISAAVLDYPSPTLINFGKVFDDETLIFGGSHIAKIWGVLDYLNSLDRIYDDGIAVLVDGYDVWFQLRPEVLLGRYFSTITYQNGRIRTQLGNEAARNEDVSQKVIFSSQKRCWPKEADSPACYAVPESSLRPDVYGLDTDTDVDDERNLYLRHRQRFLNSGMAMDPVSALRAIFQRALEKTKEKGVGFGSDQGIFAEIFGEQEFQQHCIAKQYRRASKPNRIVDAWNKEFDVTDPQTAGTHEIMDCAGDNTYDFGIGLDYDMILSQATVFSEYDTAWLRLDDAHAIEQASLAQTPLTEPRVNAGRIPADIARSRPPFHTELERRLYTADLPLEKSWGQVPLFTNLYTGFSPVAVHHNAHRDGLKGRIQSHWNETWFQPYARTLLDLRVMEPARPIEVEVDVVEGRGEEGSSSIKRAYWAPHASDFENERAGVTTIAGDFMRYEQMCTGWEELFRDDKGPWRDPRERV